MPPRLPVALLSALHNIKGFDETAFIQAHETAASLTSVRMNPHKPVDHTHFDFSIEQKVPWSTEGYYLSSRPSFTIDPLFHAGAYYVQEASSMFLEQAIRQSVDLQNDLTVLDLCAAPGGKSTLIQSILTPQSILISNEVIKTRVTVLVENLSKWGAANVVVCNNDPKDFQRLPEYFDLIVVDAPCSGSGLFRKDPEAINEWSENNVALCSQRQQRILHDVMSALKPGGVLIYSTCSYSTEEDEAIADWLLEQYPLDTMPLKLEESWKIVETRSAERQAFGYRFYPHLLKGEGFFISVFKKQGAVTPGHQKRKKGNQALASRPIQALSQQWINDMTGRSLLPWKQELLIMPQSLWEEIPFLQSVLYLKKAGVSMGTMIREELLPAHELALSGLLQTNIPSVEVDHETALQYLRRQPIQIETNLSGWAMVTYRSVALGWIKILSNRINNYYPKDWRILNK